MYDDEDDYGSDAREKIKGSKVMRIVKVVLIQEMWTEETKDFGTLWWVSTISEAWKKRLDVDAGTGRINCKQTY